MSNNLESLHEGFMSEVDELQSILENVEEFTLKAKRNSIAKQLRNIISNLNSSCDSLYSEFENGTENDYEELSNNYAIVLSLLNERIDHEEQLYIKLKYGIDVGRI